MLRLYCVCLCLHTHVFLCYHCVHMPVSHLCMFLCLLSVSMSCVFVSSLCVCTHYLYRMSVSVQCLRTSPVLCNSPPTLPWFFPSSSTFHLVCDQRNCPSPVWLQAPPFPVAVLIPLHLSLLLALVALSWLVSMFLSSFSCPKSWLEKWHSGWTLLLCLTNYLTNPGIDPTSGPGMILGHRAWLRTWGSVCEPQFSHLCTFL